MSFARFVLALAAVWLPGSSVGQDAPSPRRSVTAGPPDLFANVGLAATDEGLAGAGPGYVVRFSAAAVEFTPALGAAAPRNLPLAYRLMAAGRGTPVPVGAAAPLADGSTVRYEHGTVTAIYELRQTGLKQSFVFRELPPGAGDLVVRGQLASELPLARADASRLDFELPGIGGIRIGAVIGIDAAGRRVEGELRLGSGRLDYVLPASFVDEAALPLVVDPLIHPVLQVSLGGWDRDPDVAYDATNDLFLVVFQTRVSATDQNLYAQRFTTTGAVGSLIPLEIASGTQPSDPCVANVDASDGFVVAWQLNGDIQARGVAAGTGAVTATVNVAAGTDVQIEPDLGGEAGPTHTAAVCVWRNDTTDDVQARHLIYSPGSLLVGLTVTTFANPAASPYYSPSIAQHHGASGHRLICWERFVSLGTANQAIVAVVVDRNLATVAGPTLLFNNALDESDPDCDGDGAHWVLAFEREESAGSADRDLLAVPLHLAGTTLVAGSEVNVTAMPGLDEIDPSVGWLQDSCLIGYAQQRTTSSSDYDTMVRSTDPFDCTYCEAIYPLRLSSTSDESGTAIAWRLGAGGGDEAMIVWASNLAAVPTPAPPSIEAILFRGEDGIVTQVHAGCGTGGELRGKCARAGQELGLALYGAAGNATAFLVLATGRIDQPCGPCLLVPDPYAGFVGVTATTAVGDAAMPLVLPPIVSGMAFYAQYVTVGGACWGGFSLSNALLVNVQ